MVPLVSVGEGYPFFQGKPKANYPFRTPNSVLRHIQTDFPCFWDRILVRRLGLARNGMPYSAFEETSRPVLETHKLRICPMHQQNSEPPHASLKPHRITPAPCICTPNRHSSPQALGTMHPWNPPWHETIDGPDPTFQHLPSFVDRRDFGCQVGMLPGKCSWRAPQNPLRLRIFVSS